MSPKRGASGLCGVLAIDKPHGMTSHDVVDQVRRITGERRVGHAGTLDPAATGLMLVGVGAATRLSEYLTGHDKEYDARIVFGISTDTDDAEGRALNVTGPDTVREAMASVEPQSVLDRFTGVIEQLPPAYSAIKKNGVVAYKAAREGSCLELQTRSVTVYDAVLEEIGECPVQIADGEGGFVERSLPYWDVRFSVSKGTYIRALARDIGAYLGCGAYLGALRRTSIAAFPVEGACALEDLSDRMATGLPLPWCDPTLLLGFPVVELGEQQAKCVSNGRELGNVDAAEEGMVSCVSGNRLLAVYRWKSGACRPDTVIPGGVVGVG